MMMIHSALWIAPEGAANVEPCHFRAEKNINIGTVPGSVTVQIACDSCYTLEINGKAFPIQAGEQEFLL